MSVFESFQASVEAAGHIDADGVDAAAVAAAGALARKIDEWDVIVEWAREDAAETESRPKVPANDNTSLPTFLRYCEALGLTPAARKAVGDQPKKEADPLADLKSKRHGSLRAVGGN
ncbi:MULTISPECIES: hypothetical protein [unclassified Glutamicibacter]|uniref:terminase small subunit n=1 Tax=unclassified Glutamicibacter TaxID=2627139 RepID=UPI003828D817